MKLYIMFTVTITWFMCQGLYLILRIRALYKAFRESACKVFLDYFEQEYLNKTGGTWRRRYNFFYNTKLYKICNYLVAFLSIAVAVLLLVFIIYVSNTEYANVLKESI